MVLFQLTSAQAAPRAEEQLRLARGRLPFCPSVLMTHAVRVCLLASAALY